MEKCELFQKMLALGMVSLTLDPRQATVIVPHQFKRDTHLVINVSRRFVMPEFEVNQQQLLVSLTFSKAAFRCIIPWSAVFAMTCRETSETRIWQESVPDAYRLELASNVFGTTKATNKFSN